MPKTFDTFQKNPWIHTSKIQSNGCFGMRRQDKVCFCNKSPPKFQRKADTFQMLRICLSCQPLKTELQMGMEPQKTFYTTDGSWIDWNPIALEKTPNTPFGKAEKKCSKRWMTKDYSSTNISEAKEGSKRRNSRNASHQNPRNRRNLKICKYVVSQLLSFFHFQGCDRRISRVLGAFHCIRGIRREVDFGLPPFQHSLHAFQKVRGGFLFHSDGVQFDPKTIGCIEGFLWSYSDLQFYFVG